MTVRTLNYTKRQRLKRDDLDFLIFTTRLGNYAFDASLKLEKYKLPADARVFVEAYRQTQWVRFDFGTVSAMVPPKNRELAIFDIVDGILFRVRVAAAADSRCLLIAEGDRIPFRSKDEKPKKRIPLLPVVPEVLQDEICKVSFEGSGPELVVNSSLGNWRGVARDPIVIALIYPFVLREILARISFQEGDFDLDDRTDWRTRWCIFAQQLPGVDSYPDAEDERDDWIEKAVMAFSRRNAILAKFGQYWKTEVLQ